jgi:DUF971 family protein
MIQSTRVPRGSFRDELQGLQVRSTLVVTSAVRPGEVTVTGAEKVGWYAVRFEWSDGHNTGIYTLESLRQLGAEDGN